MVSAFFLFAILAAACCPAWAQTQPQPGPAPEQRQIETVPGEPAKQPPVAKEPASQYFTSSDGVRLHYIAEGAGETLLFVPGWLMPAEIWRHQIDYFARKYRVIAFDPRSQGDSQVAPSGNNIQRRAQDLAELIEHVQGKRVVLVGWSLGVMEALLYIRNYGDDSLAALVLVDNSVGEHPPQSGGATIPRRPPSDRRGEMADFVRAIHKSPQTPAYLAWLTGMVMRTPVEASNSLLSIPYRGSFWRSIVYETQKPLLFAVTAGLKGQADTLRRKRKETSTEVFPEAGHALFVDAHERFNSVLDAFLERTLKEQTAGSVVNTGIAPIEQIEE